MLSHLIQEAKNLVKKYTSAYLSRLMQREGLKKMLWNPYSSLSILEKILQDNGQDPNAIFQDLTGSYTILPGHTGS